MPSTYTTNTGIEKPGDGEQTSTWGNTVNANMDILDRALNGVGALTLTGTSSTLSTADGTLSDGAYGLLVLSGSLSAGHTITVSPADAQKIYMVKNSAGDTVTFTQGSGVETASVADGQFAIIYADGSDECHDVTASLVRSSSLDGTVQIAPDLTEGSWEIGGVAVTATAAELNKLDGVTASTAEINLLTGLSPTTTELNYVDGVTSSIQAQLDSKEDADAEILKADTDDNLTAGYTATADNDGTQSSGTYTPAPAGGNLKRIVNGGAFTLAAPTATGDYTLVIQMTNNASAGAVTVSGFTRQSGDALSTTDGDDFFLYITKINGFTALHVTALQ